MFQTQGFILRSMVQYVLRAEITTKGFCWFISYNYIIMHGAKT